MQQYRIEQLSAESGLSVDTIRFYQRLKLLKPPQKEGRIAYYHSSHLKRLKEIRRLLGNGFSLKQIATLTNGSPASGDPILAALDIGPPITKRTLVQRSGVSEEIVTLAIENGLVQPIYGSKEKYLPDSAEMLASASTLLTAGMPVEELLALAIKHAVYVDEVVTDAIELFEKAIRSANPNAKISRSKVSKQIEELIPQVVGLAARHFQQTLVTKAAQHAAGTAK